MSAILVALCCPCCQASLYIRLIEGLYPKNARGTELGSVTSSFIVNRLTSPSNKGHCWSKITRHTKPNFIFLLYFNHLDWSRTMLDAWLLLLWEIQSSYPRSEGKDFPFKPYACNIRCDPCSCDLDSYSCLHLSPLPPLPPSLKQVSYWQNQ